MKIQFRHGRLLAAGIIALGAAACQTTMPSIPGPAPTDPPVIQASATTNRYSLADAIATAHANHPSLKAMNHSITAAMVKQRGLGEVRRNSGPLLPDLDIRTQQASLGIQASTAELEQAQHEVTYAVVRCYYTIIYVKEQNKVAKDLIEQLDTYLEQIRKIVNSKEGIKGITKDTEEKLVVLRAEAKGKMIASEAGIAKAKAAFREALGVPPGTQVDVADEMLPEVVLDREVTRDEVIGHALSRRGEVILAGLGQDITRLEACAQWSRKILLHVPTFANGADIHSRYVPGPQRDPDYKPGAIAMEMPDNLVGKRETRTEVAGHYAARTQEAARQTRSLVGLEAEVGLAKYNESKKHVENFREAAKAGKNLIERQREATGGNLTKEDILTNEVSAAKAFASFNESLYEQLMSLANLERITAGGVRVNWPGR